MRNKFPLKWIIIFFGALLIVCQLAVAANTPSVKLVFVQSIHKGKIIKKDDNLYILTVSNPNRIVAFSEEQEYRYVKSLFMKEYVPELEKTLKKENKNSVLVLFKPLVFSDKHMVKKIILTIKAISYSAKKDELVYTISLLNTDIPINALKEGISITSSVLFIDSACASCGGEGS